MTLLVTSAKAGEGKSTTALNLAATCARPASGPCSWTSTCAGPAWPMSSSRMKPRPRSTGWSTCSAASCPGSGRSATPRSPTSTSSRPATRATIPIEILGTLELRQFLIALSHHYDRVILDGPAVLGLADCRVLGRIVDASLLVVRSGSHHLMTLHRAKAMLEQSHVAIAGVVFNGLTEDMNNWSSYGYEPISLPGGRLDPGASEPGTARAGGERLKPDEYGRSPVESEASCSALACNCHDQERLIVNLRPRILLATDRVLAAAVVALVLGSAVCFGGAVWWFRPAVAVLGFLLAGTKLAQLLIQGRMPFLKSPLTLLGLLALALGRACSLFPCRRRWLAGSRPSRRRSIRIGVLAEAGADRPSRGRAGRAGSGPVAGDARPRRDSALAGGSRCLPGDLLGRLAFRGSAGAAVPGVGKRRGGVPAQCGARAGADRRPGRRVVRFLRPGQAPIWAPSLDDLLESPSHSGPAPLERSPAATGPAPALEPMAVVPEQPFWFGTMMGGAGAFLAFGSLALPLAPGDRAPPAFAAREPREPVIPAEPLGAGEPGRAARDLARRRARSWSD